MLKTRQPSRTKTLRQSASARTRRTTLTLPVNVLKELERFAGERHQTVSSAAASLLQQALRVQPNAQANGRNFLERLQASFAGLTEREQMLVDGIILEEPDADSK
jgi:CopG antitoxin of type II toxin-antitoxin system